MNDEMKLTHELLKLLVQIAWADEVITDREAEHILFIARAAALEPDALREIEDALKGRAKPPAPDLGLLREHREEALAAARVLATQDENVAESESQMLDTLAELLS